MLLTRVRKVYQTSGDARNNSCLPACVSSLTGIPMREVPYQPRHIKTDWIEHIESFLKTRGFSFKRVPGLFIDLSSLYIMCYEYTVDDEPSAHACISRGSYCIHEPGKYLTKKLIPYDCEVVIGRYKFLEIRKL
jgi:hypothetical protein